MNKTKFTVRIEHSLLEDAKRYAEKHNTTVSRLITEFFRSLPPEATKHHTPLLRKLAGILAPDTESKEYQEYLEDKYLGG